MIPAKQRRQVEAADLMNLIRSEGAEVHTATQAFQIGQVQVRPATTSSAWISRTAASSTRCLGVQWYPAENPRPYDDTGWDIPALRNLKAYRIDDKTILDKPMTLASADFAIAGAISGTGSTIVIDHTTDNTLATFRFANKDVKMAGRRAGVRHGRPSLRGRRVRDREREPRGARAADQASTASGVGDECRAVGADARHDGAADRLHPLVDEHAG